MASGATFVKSPVSVQDSSVVAVLGVGYHLPAEQKCQHRGEDRDSRFHGCLFLYLDMVPISTGPCPSPTSIVTLVLYAGFSPVIRASYRACPQVWEPPMEKPGRGIWAGPVVGSAMLSIL